MATNTAAARSVSNKGVLPFTIFRAQSVPAELTAETERRRSESNRRMEVLQTSALPLGYGAGRTPNLFLCLAFLKVPDAPGAGSCGPANMGDH